VTWIHHAIAMAFLFTLGAVLGSFLNVCVYRIPRGRSVLHPPSCCPSCAAAIAPRDNLPIVGWLVLRGRCRCCGLPISPRYPLVEAAVGLLLVALHRVDPALNHGDPFDAGLAAAAWHLAATLTLLAFLVTGTLIAYDTGAIPARVAAAGTIAGFALEAVRPAGPGTMVLASFRDGLAGLAVGGGMVQAFRWVTRPRAAEGGRAAIPGGPPPAPGGRLPAGPYDVLGRGDVAFAAMVGTFVGGRTAALMLVLALVLGRAGAALGAGAPAGRCRNAAAPIPGRNGLPAGVVLGLAALGLLLAGPWLRGGG
jgi:leader peptidase (prepilin peptidase)/N-methyltransferase